MNGTVKPPRLGFWGWVSIAFAGATVIVAAISLWSLVATLFVPSARPTGDAAGDQAKAEAYKKSFETLVAQLDGRSLFLVPGSPTPPPPPPPPDDGTKPALPPPAYGGPKIIAMINDSVWFDDGKRLQVGGEKSGDIQVISLQAPWGAVIAYKDVQFTVNFFSRDSVVMPEKKSDKPDADGIAESAKDDSKGEKSADSSKPDAAKPGDPAKPETKPEPKPNPTPGNPNPGDTPPPAPGGETPPKPPEPKPSDPAAPGPTTPPSPVPTTPKETK